MASSHCAYISGMLLLKPIMYTQYNSVHFTVLVGICCAVEHIFTPMHTHAYLVLPIHDFLGNLCYMHTHTSHTRTSHTHTHITHTPHTDTTHHSKSKFAQHWVLVALLHTHTPTHTYAHTHAHTHTHTCTHTCTHKHTPTTHTHTIQHSRLRLA